MDRLSRLMQEKKIVIIGGGVAGAATAWGLAELGGYEVLVLEREEHLAAHSTSQNAGILRTFTEHEATTELGFETGAFLADPPPGFTEVPLVDPVGLVMVPVSFDPEAFLRWRARRSPGSVVDLEPRELAELAPHYAGSAEGAVLVKDEGHLDPAALFEGFVRGARRGGARFETGGEVAEFLLEGGVVRGVRLKDNREIPADLTVIAAGGWASRLGEAAGSRLRFEARRRHILVTGHDSRIDPRWPVVWSEADAFYVKPESGGLMVCACDQDVIDPDQCGTRPEVLEMIAERVARCLHGFDDAPAAHFWAGMRTFPEDNSFAVGPDPDVEGLFWVSGLGGHGMSTSVGLGRLAAALIAGERADTEVARELAPERLVERKSGS